MPWAAVGRALLMSSVRSGHGHIPAGGVAPRERRCVGMAYVIAEPCVDVHDRACVDECPVDCIYDGLRKSYIQPDECVECGACEPVCPVNAIFQQNDLPDEWRQYVQIERQFFEPGVT